MVACTPETTVASCQLGRDLIGKVVLYIRDRREARLTGPAVSDSGSCGALALNSDPRGKERVQPTPGYLTNPWLGF